MTDETQTKPRPCPLCKRITLVAHCPEARCNWWLCRNKDCEALLDFRAKRGHVKVPGSIERRKADFLPSGEVA